MTPPNQLPSNGGSSSRGDPTRKRRNPFPSKRNRPFARSFGDAATAQKAQGEGEGENIATASTTVQQPSKPSKSSNSTFDNDRFAELQRFNVHPNLLNTIHLDLKLTTMTAVQAETLPVTLTGSDVLAQAKTGTGKTIAFLLPAIQKLITSPASATSIHPRLRPVSLLVISPTRELATQIAQEAKALLKNSPGYMVEVAVGGTNARSGLNRVVNGCDILVATPGRLLDFLGQDDSKVRDKVQGVQTLVLDEADRLMDMGFLPDIQKIVRYLPNQAAANRQGMLFSATINPRVQQFASLVLADGYKFICTIPAGTPQTHEHVPQSLITVPKFSSLATAVLGALRHEMNAIGKDKFKAIVFAPTAAQTDFYAEVLGQFRDLPTVLPVSSRMTQSRRTKNTDDYRKAQSAILVATDVVARGLDFPGVTTVLQVGLPADKDAYIHRLGRTARAGAEGRGALVLAQAEVPFAKSTMKMVDFEDTPVDMSAHADVMAAVGGIEEDKRSKVYRAWLGFYKSHLKTLRWTPETLVAQANMLAKDGLGMSTIPGLERKTVGKMGLKGVPGLNITSSVDSRR